MADRVIKPKPPPLINASGFRCKTIQASSELFKIINRLWFFIFIKAGTIWQPRRMLINKAEVEYQYLATWKFITTWEAIINAGFGNLHQSNGNTDKSFILPVYLFLYWGVGHMVMQSEKQKQQNLAFHHRSAIQQKCSQCPRCWRTPWIWGLERNDLEDPIQPKPFYHSLPLWSLRSI